MEILTCATTQNLEDILLSELSQPQKDKYCTIPLSEAPRVSKIAETEGLNGGCKGVKKGEIRKLLMGIYAYGERVSFAGRREFWTLFALQCVFNTA